MSKDKNKLIPELRFPEFEALWKIITLSEVCDVFRGGTFSKADMDENGTEPCIHYGELFTKYNEVISYIFSKTNKSDGFRSQAGDILMPSSDVTPNGLAKASAIIIDDVVLGGDMNIIRPKTDINSIFLSYLLNHSKSEIIKLVSGTTVKHIYPSQIINCQIPIINCQKEQQKIASCLSSIDEVITAHNQKLDTLKNHKKGLMQNLFPQLSELGLDRLKDDRIKGKEILKSQNPKNHNSDNVPKYRFPEFLEDGEWVEKSLGSIAEIITGNTPSTLDITNYNGNNLFVSPGDISDNRYVIQTKTTLSEIGFSKTRKVKAYSILFVCIGSTIGKVAQNRFECATNQQLNSLIPFEENSSDFLYSILDFNSSQIASIAGNHAVPIINKTSFSAIRLNFPPTAKEQQKIASCLSSLDDLITAQTEKIKQLKLHKKGLMQGLFPKLSEL